MEKTMYAYVNKALRGKNHTAITFFNTDVSASRMLDDVDRLATFLLSHGIREGESVAICLPNIPEAIIAFYAVNKIGAVANMVHPLIGTDGLGGILERTNSRYLFLMDGFFEVHRKILDKLSVKVIVCSPENYLHGLTKLAFHLKNAAVARAAVGENVIAFRETQGEIKEISPKGEPDTVCAYLHSGGTTGEPKTVMLNNFALNSLADSLEEWLTRKSPVSTDDAMLMVLPLFHGFGLGVCMHTILPHFRVVMVPSFNAKKAVKLIKKEKISFIAGVPAMFQKLLSAPGFEGEHLKNLRFVFSGGDKLPDNLKVEFDSAIKRSGGTAELLEGYGLTETVTVCTINPEGEARTSSIGKSIPKTEFIIFDGEKECPTGTAGEILVAGDTLMSGYLDDPKATEAAFIEYEGKKYVRSGDCGYVDDCGYLFFKDRYKRVVKIAGIGVFPAEIEAAVLQLSEINRACAVDGAQNGEKSYIKLFIELKPGIAYSEELESKIKQRVGASLIKYAVPRKIVVKDKLPLTKVGKIDVAKLLNE